MTKAFNSELKSYGKIDIYSSWFYENAMGRKVKNQDFNTFIDPHEIANIMKYLLINEKSMSIDELK